MDENNSYLNKRDELLNENEKKLAHRETFKRVIRLYIFSRWAISNFEINLLGGSRCIPLVWTCDWNYVFH